LLQGKGRSPTSPPAPTHLLQQPAHARRAQCQLRALAAAQRKGLCAAGVHVHEVHALALCASAGACCKVGGGGGRVVPQGRQRVRGEGRGAEHGQRRQPPPLVLQDAREAGAREERAAVRLFLWAAGTAGPSLVGSQVCVRAYASVRACMHACMLGVQAQTRHGRSSTRRVPYHG